MAAQRKGRAAGSSARAAVPVATGTKRKAEQAVSEPVQAPSKSRVAKRELEDVSHPSHGTVPGSIFVFGDGDCGQLGLGEDITERLRPFPLELETGEKALQVACGGMHTVALTEGHQLYSWGVNDEGALGRETGGELWEKSGLATGKAGDSYTPGKVDIDQSLGKIVQISAGDSHTAALTSRGAVWAWGTFRDASGVFGFSPGVRIQLVPTLVYEPKTPEDQIVKIASGADHVVALTRSGSVLTWGNGQQGQLGRVGERLSDRVKTATLLLPARLPLRRGRSGGEGRGVDVAAGTYATFVLTAAGGLLGTGLNNYGQLGVDNGGALVFAPTPVAELTHRGTPVAVRPGQHHTLVLVREQGSDDDAPPRLYSFGRPTYGRLGQKDADVAADSSCPRPEPVDGLEGQAIAGAAAGLAVSGAFSVDGTAWLWGFGTSNQLAKGDDDEDEILPRKMAPTKKLANQKVIALEFGGQHGALLCVDKPSDAEA